MKATYVNNLTSSFYLWLDHEILSRGDAFTTYSGKLYEGQDPTFGRTASVYAAPFRQWVYDSSISGAYVPNGVNSGASFIPRLQNGLSIDFNRGRAIFNGNTISSNADISAKYSFKDFNIYYTDEREDKILFEKSYTLTPQTVRVTGGLGPNDLPYPCIFIKLKTNENSPFAFGGMDMSNYWMRCIILARESFSLDGATSLLADSSRKTFPVFGADQLPFNYLGDFKSGVTGYNYEESCGAQDSASLVYIDKVTTSKFDEIDNLYINKKIVAASVDFELKSIRYPRF